MRQRVLVCGGRKYANRELLFDVLDVANLANPIELLMQGGADGADELASEWAKIRGINSRTWPAYWKEEGRAAGPKRNKRMLEEGNPHLVIAFPGGSGTQNMVEQAQAAGVPVAIVRR